MASKEEQEESSMFISSMQMCSLIANLKSDAEAFRAKLNFPYYTVREHDKIIKKDINEIIDILNMQDWCDKARSEFISLIKR